MTIRILFPTVLRNKYLLFPFSFCRVVQNRAGLSYLEKSSSSLSNQIPRSRSRRLVRFYWNRSFRLIILIQRFYKSASARCVMCVYIVSWDRRLSIGLLGSDINSTRGLLWLYVCMIDWLRSPLRWCPWNGRSTGPRGEVPQDLFSLWLCSLKPITLHKIFALELTFGRDVLVTQGLGKRSVGCLIVGSGFFPVSFFVIYLLKLGRRLENKW